jgi:hypothetical protein
MTRRLSWGNVLEALLLGLVATRAQAEVLAVADFKARQHWVKHHLVETEHRKTRQAVLQVWSCHGGLLRNGRDGRSLVIADQEYKRGLLTHAPSKVLLVPQLHLPLLTYRNGHAQDRSRLRAFEEDDG